MWAKSNTSIDFYPLWNYITKVSKMRGGGAREWICNLCQKPYLPKSEGNFFAGKGKESACFPKDN